MKGTPTYNRIIRKVNAEADSIFWAWLHLTRMDTTDFGGQALYNLDEALARLDATHQDITDYTCTERLAALEAIDQDAEPEGDREDSRMDTRHPGVRVMDAMNYHI